MTEQNTEATAVQPTGPEPAPTPAPTPTEAARPDWLPEKFKSPEQLAQAYAELEKKLGQPKEAPAEAPKETPKATEGTAPTPEEELAVRRAGLDPEAIEAEFLDSGKISEETYKKAEKIGLTRAFVDAFAQGRAAVAQRQLAELFTEVGGQEEFQRVSSWARANLQPSAISAIDRATQSGSLDEAKLVLRGLYARYQAAVGKNPNLVSGDAPGSGDGFRSAAEVREAMRDPRYSRDPAYRADVEAKVRASGSLFQVRTG
jgi:hypothetical protein